VAKTIIKFIKNDTVFWLFFIVLCFLMLTFIMKKEDIKVTITLSEPYDNKVITLFGR
jgi:hypothetical protein